MRSIVNTVGADSASRGITYQVTMFACPKNQGASIKDINVHIATIPSPTIKPNISASSRAARNTLPQAATSVGSHSQLRKPSAISPTA